jgi:hypothetical protein
MVGGEEVSVSLALKANREVIKDYFHLFVNRRAMRRLRPPIPACARSRKGPGPRYRRR